MIYRVLVKPFPINRRVWGKALCFTNPQTPAVREIKVIRQAIHYMIEFFSRIEMLCSNVYYDILLIERGRFQ